MAAASSSSNNTSDSNSPVTYYHVFLSFRGEDTRYGFTDHLHTALEAAGFHTFRDKEDLNRGENISPGLENGIQNSRCSVIVFSKTYTSSQWCLDELVMILQLKKTSNHVVLPVFYDVDPSELRKQTGKSAEAFARHEERFEAEIGKVDRWRAALKEAANLSGLNLQDEANRHEAKFIEKIVNEVKNKLMSTTVSVTPYLIGRDSQLAEINLWLNDGSLDVGILLICGIPGIGKTTIAKSVYRSNRSRFRGGGFLDNISEISRKPNGLVNIQSELLSQLTRGNREMIIHNVIQGTNRIREVVGSKKLILVLDDVDQRNQLDAVIGMRDWFYRGSKIIITTSKEGAQLVSAHEVSKVHVVKPLRKDESLELFSCYAFRQNLPIDERYKKLSTEIVNHCEGHPLALRVLGSSLSWKSITYWEKAIANLKSTPNGEILTKLKISYNTLGDDHVQNLFLDIACFFIGENIDFVVTVLDECDYRIKNGIQDLQDRYLITIDEHNHVRMHNLLRDMGREIIRQESPKEPGERSRLWNDNESYNVLTEKTGKQAMEGIVLHRQNILNEQVILNTEAFAKMRRLRLLILSEVELKGNYKSFPTRLRWLCWYRFPLKYIHNDFLLESLVVLQMLDSNLIQVWKVPKGIQEYGIFNIFLPGNKIPGLYSHKSRHTTISITWPPLPIKNFQGLNIAIVYAVDHKYHNSMVIQVHNISKGLKWIYEPTFFGYQDDGKDMIWLSHWKFGNHELEGGDEVSVSIFKLSELHYTDGFIKNNFKECGVHIVYDQEEQMSNQDNKADTSNREGIIYENQRFYEVMPGTYFINNYMTDDQYVFPSERWVHEAMRHLRKISDIDVAKSKSKSRNEVQVARSPSPQTFVAPFYTHASAKPRICSGKRKRAIIHKLPNKRSKLLCSSSGDTSSSQRITRDEVLIELGLDINASPSSEENLSEDLSGNEASDQEYFSDSHGLYDLEGLSSSNEDLYVSDCKEDETRGRDDVGLATDDGELGCNTVNGFDVDKDVAKLNIKDDHAAVGDDLFSHKDTKDLFGDYLTKMHISQDVPLDDVVPPGWLTMNSRFPYPPAGNFGISIPKSPTSNFGNIQKVSSTPSRDAMVNRGSPIDATTTSCSVAPDLSESPHPLQFSGLTEVVVADPILSDGPTVPLFNTFEGTRRTSGKFDQVYGFSVLKADVGLYKAIVDHTRQHIATREVIKTDSALITIVGNVLGIVRGMAKVTARTVSLAQLKDWASGLEDAEALRFNVGWVRERFDALVHNSKLQRNGGATINAREAEIRNAEVLVTQLKAAIERSKGELTYMENRLQVEEFALTQSREALSKAHCEKEQVEALLSEPSLGTSWGNILSDVI